MVLVWWPHEVVDLGVMLFVELLFLFKIFLDRIRSGVKKESTEKGSFAQ